MNTNHEDYYNDMLDNLHDSYEKYIFNYSLDDWENLSDDNESMMHRNLIFSRGDKDYFVVVNPAGQIITMHPDTPTDLVVQISNCSITCLYEDRVCP